MKKIQIILSFIFLILAVSCQKEKIPTWSGDDRIRFRTDRMNDTLQGYSFLGKISDTTLHVMHIEVNVEGQVRNFPRTISLKQVATGNDDAVPGTHYVAFSDAQVKDLYVIPAGSATAIVPIILLRHSSLLNEEKILRIELAENEHFRLSTDDILTFRYITFAEKPVKSDVWDVAVAATSNTTTPYFGVYGTEKHRFMSRVTNMSFDNTWFSEIFMWTTVAATGMQWMIPRDTGYVNYLRQLLQNRLNEENAAAGEGNELKETDGTIVRFI